MINRKLKKLYTEDLSAINTDSFDRDRFLQLTNISSKLGELTEEKVRQDTSSLAMMGDLWASLFKVDPTVKEQEEGQSSPIHKPIMERVLEDESYMKMRSTTKLDDLNSALGTMRMTEVVTEWIEGQKRENEKMKKEMDELNRKRKEQLENQDKKETEKQKEKNSQLQSEIEQLEQSISSQMQDSLDKNGDSLSEGIAKAKEKTSEGKEDLKNLLGGGAGSGDSELQKIPLRDQINLAETLHKNTKVREIAEWAGKFKSIARKKQKSKHTDSLDRSGMTIGNDVERLLPQELALLVKEETKRDFLRRFAEGQTMMYSPKGKETLGKGPIVVCMDQSGSMTDLDNQSKGFVLALAMIAKKQRRDFCVITFSNRVAKTYLYEKGKITPTQLVELATDFQGGGTQYAPPLSEAMNIIEKYKRFNKADLIFVTDGEPGDTGILSKEEWMKTFLYQKNKKQVQILSLLIGDQVSSRWVLPFSDKIVKASDFDKEETAEVFAI